MRVVLRIKSKNLPKEGWLQHCIVCGIVTSREKYYRTIGDIQIYAYICKDCRDIYSKHPNRERRFRRMCESYIISQWSQIHPSLEAFLPVFPPHEHIFLEDLEHTIETVADLS
ncbi:hypothetical protein [uncultured Mediterranean phage]|nr:hypothetical protein [uncultured Mediterranean phage]